MSTPTAPEGTPRSRCFFWAVLPALSMGFVLLLSHWRPANDPTTSACLFRRFTHLACPGCGFSRALAALARGELESAWALHPLAPVVVAECLVLWLAAGLAARREKPWSWGRLLPRLVLGHLVAFLGVWALRWALGALPP